MTVRGFSIVIVVIFCVFRIGDNTLTVYESFETVRSRPRAFFSNKPQETTVNQRYKYREFAETEFHRPRYLPFPYVVGGIQNSNNNIGDLRTMPTPNADLSQLIRQHISHQRNKLLRDQHNRLPTTILEGVTHVTELRQTPFRRFPESSPANRISYEEKRRRWKAELNRRLRGHEVMTRPISGVYGNVSAIIVKDLQVLPTAIDDSDRYYVTYSPQSRVYQVSRRPPQNYDEPVALPTAPSAAETTDMKNNTLQPIILPTDETPKSPFSYEMNDRRQEDDINKMVTTAETLTETTKLPDTMTSFVRWKNSENNSFEYNVTESPTPHGVVENEPRQYLIAPSMPFTKTTAAITTKEPKTATSTASIFVVQKAKTFPHNLIFFQQIRVASERPPLVVQHEFPIVKQILHLDDYYQEMEDEEGNVATAFSSTTTQATTTSATIRSIGQTQFDVRKIKEANNNMDRSVIKLASRLELKFNTSDSQNGSSQASQMVAGDALKRAYSVIQPPSVATTPLSQALDDRRNGYQEVEEEKDDDDDLFFWRPESNSQKRHSL